ncbi:hypothetical protein EYV94_18375 [Puteibacter caeruleilacunae]|nr:hypothetical protein EYV94_18375 [Puteibacter caeruleilacunae]
MKNLKKVLLQLPEYLLIIAVVSYWGAEGVFINPIAIALMLVLIFQIIFKNRVVGIVIPGFLILASLYMLLALMSEFNEFTSFNSEAKEFLLVGLSLFILAILISGTMIYRYSTMDESGDEQLLEGS